MTASAVGIGASARACIDSQYDIVPGAGGSRQLVWFGGGVVPRRYESTAINAAICTSSAVSPPVSTRSVAGWEITWTPRAVSPTAEARPSGFGDRGPIADQPPGAALLRRWLRVRQWGSILRVAVWSATRTADLAVQPRGQRDRLSGGFFVDVVEGVAQPLEPCPHGGNVADAGERAHGTAGEVFVVGVEVGCGPGEVRCLPRVDVGEQVGQLQSGVNAVPAQLLAGLLDPVVVVAVGEGAGVRGHGALKGGDAIGRLAGCGGLAQCVQEHPHVDVEQAGVEVVAASGVDHGLDVGVGGGLTDAPA